MSTFLTARWQELIMANYAVPPAALAQYVPHGTELDLYEGVCYVSLVGFLFSDTRLKGISIPFHTQFEEVNLRFYVRRQEGNTWRRGTVFIRELVPKPAISLVANLLYGEHYRTVAMRHRWERSDQQATFLYAWRLGTEWQHIAATVSPVSIPLIPDSVEAFITEHYWGYTRLGPQRTSAYQVAHPSWETYPVLSADISCDGARLYGPAFGMIGRDAPASVLVATGSEVSVLERTFI
ncbi:MAG: DUF2071 domain-containing protein [Bacteroidia bacterium]|nr:DUF2071 domain-containing protein [Bacteroidia bacterium]